MEPVSSSEHWQRVYTARNEEELSWYEPVPGISLDLLLTPSLQKDAAILDVGGGASHLVDALLDRGFTQASVLDIAESALEKAQSRLAEKASRCIGSSRTLPSGSLKKYNAWHDRAVFHFLTTEQDRRAYRAALEKALLPGGIVVIGTFALDGPERCSGLPVQRYSPESLSAELGDAFRWTASRKVEHTTPAGKVQRFQFSRFVRD